MEKKKRLLFFHIIFLLLALFIYGMCRYSLYKAGYTASEHGSYFGTFVKAGILSPLFLTVSFVIWLVIIVKCGPKYLFPSIILVVLSFLLVFWITKDWTITQGYSDYINANTNVEEIHKWLVDYEMSDYEFINEDGSKHGSVDDFDYPDCIKALNPHDVLIFEKNSKRYILLRYSFGPGMSYGLCVMEEPMDIPDYIDDRSDNRIQLQDIAFVWSS
jgi:predicted membrane protein